MSSAKRSNFLNLKKKLVSPGIIITVSLRTHRPPITVNRQQSAVFNRLHTGCRSGVNNGISFYQAAPPRSVQSINNRLRRHTERNLLREGALRELILKHRQIRIIIPGEQMLSGLEAAGLNPIPRRRLS